MIRFIKNIEEFEKYKADLNKIKLNEIDTYPFSVKLEDDIVFYKEFYLAFTNFIKHNDEDSFVFYVSEPSPEEYFYKHFGSYNLLTVKVNCSYSEYYKMLNKDPGNSLADALISNSKKIMLFSESKNWFLELDRVKEKCIAKFIDIDTKKLFLHFFEHEFFKI